MRILIVGLNFAPEPVGIGKYTGEMAAWLADRGHSVAVVTAQPFYPYWRTMEGYCHRRTKHEQLGNVEVQRCPLYVPARPKGVRRVLHIASFGAASLPIALRAAARFKPEIVAAVVPTLCAVPAALAAARIAGAKRWIHVQDLEVDAAFDLGILRTNVFRSAALAGECALLTRFDLATTISAAMLERLAEKGVPSEKLALLPNWVDVQRITRQPVNRSWRRRLGIPDDRVVVLYSGSMGEKHGLDLITAAARMLVGARMHFVIAGDGPGMASLAASAAGLENVTLLPLQPADALNDFLAIADIHFLPQRAEAADLVMPSKLGGMLASGRPVLATVAPNSSVGRAMGGCGIITPAGDAAAAADALRRLAEAPEERERLGLAARTAALTLSQEDVLQRLELRLQALIAEPAILSSNRLRRPS